MSTNSDEARTYEKGAMLAWSGQRLGLDYLMSVRTGQTQAAELGITGLTDMRAIPPGTPCENTAAAMQNGIATLITKTLGIPGAIAVMIAEGVIGEWQLAELTFTLTDGSLKALSDFMQKAHDEREFDWPCDALAALCKAGYSVPASDGHGRSVAISLKTGEFLDMN